MSIHCRLIPPYGLAALAWLCITGPSALAQPGCLSGPFKFDVGVIGKVTLCGDYDAKVPELQKQLTQMQQTLNGNQALLREVTHAARNINALSRDVDADRKTQLLQSFSKQLQELVSADQAKTQAKLSDLNDKLDSLKDLIAEKRGDEKTAAQTNDALKGQLGTAIAALDINNANEQLKSIQAKLDKIGAEVASTDERTKAMLEMMSKSFAEVSVRAFQATADWDLVVRAVPSATHDSPKVRMVMLDIPSGTVRTVLSAWSTQVLPISLANTFRVHWGSSVFGRRLIVCYTAHQIGLPGAWRLTSLFHVQFNGNIPAFVLAQTPTKEPASEAPCGGPEIEQTYQEQRDAALKEEALIKPVLASTHPAHPEGAEGTYYDVRTGAMWTPTDTDTTMNYFAARDYCTNLSLAGHDDWRLPTIDELRALYDPIRPQPLRGQDGGNETVAIRAGVQVRSYLFWSGTPGTAFVSFDKSYGTMRTFNFLLGGYYDWYVTIPDRFRVLCRRGQATLLPVPEKTYADRATGLLWTATDDGFYFEGENTQNYCKSLRLTGFKDWRVPQIEELKTLYDPSNSQVPRTRDPSDPKVYIHSPIVLSGYSVWSSTTETHYGSETGPTSGPLPLDPQALTPYFWTDEFNFQTGKVEHSTHGDLRALCVHGKETTKPETIANPAMMLFAPKYAEASIAALRPPTDDYTSLMVTFDSQPSSETHPPFVDSKFSISFRQGAQAWRIDAKRKLPFASGEVWQVKLADMGDQATICLDARDMKSRKFKEWKQHYKVTKFNSGVSTSVFEAEGPPTLQPADGAPCDGVTEVREELRPD